MDVEAKKIGVYMKKGVVFSVRICYTTARDYPFIVGVALCSFLLYRLFPSLFGFLVSSSPVIFCTAALLGILLSFGEPNIPEVEEEEKTTHDISSLKAACVDHDHVIEKDESLSMEALVERRTDEGSDGSVLHPAVCEAEEVKNADSLSGSTAVEGDTEVVHGMTEPVEEKEFHEHVIFEKKEFHDDGHATDDGKDTAGSEMEPVLTAGGILEAHLDGHDDESFDSSSDCAESSSPDASMADVMPMLDELHPLLESEAPQPSLIFVDDSETESDDDSAELHGDADNLDEEETREHQKDGSEAVVKWTADDEKNLLDLGTSELERNHRLENLIAKRIAHKNRIAEARKRNLIDFQRSPCSQISELLNEEMSHIPIQVPSLSTTKCNPFDPPYHSDEFEGLPPIPGSAPSVLLPRRNPFDLPCDQAHEGSSVMQDKSGYEYMPLQERERCFQRPESSTLGASSPGEIMQERLTGRLQPRSVSEQDTSMEIDYGSFQMQSTVRHDNETKSAPKEVSSTREAVLPTSGVSMVSMGASVESSAAEASIESEEVEKNVDVLSSSSSSETNEKHLETNADEIFVGQNPMEIDSSKEFHKSMQRTHVDGVQVKEPVYDSSPSVVAEKSNCSVARIAEAQFPSELEVFSFMSAPSDTHFEHVKEDLLPVTVKKSMDVDEANQITSSNETSSLESSKLYRVDENESRPGEIAEVSELEDSEVGFSGVIQNANDSFEPLVRTESDVKDNSQDFYSSSLDTLAMEVSVRGQDSNPQLQEAQMLLNSNNVALVGTQALEVEKTHNALSMSNGLLLVDDPIPLASQPLVEKTIAQPSLGKSQDDGSNLDEDIHVPDESIYSRFSTFAPGHDDDDLTALHIPEQPNIESSNRLEMISEEILVEKTDAGLIDLEENTLNQFRTEHLTDSEGANDKLDIDEDAEADGIKELDEGLLSELDAVGDFSVQEPKSNAIEAEMKLQSEPDSVAESLIHLATKSSLPDLQILQDESVETFGIERSAEPQSVIDLPNSEADLIQFEMSDRDPLLMEPSSEVPVPEACSLADIDLAFKQVQEGEVEKSVVSESVIEKSIGLDAEAGPSKIHPEKVDTDLLDNASRLEVLEARSVEDIESAFKQLHEGVHEKFVIQEPLLVKSESASTAAFLDTKHEVMGVKFEVSPATSELPGEGSVLSDTASHICDNDAAFKQSYEVDHDESVVEESIMVESEFGPYISSTEEKHLDLPKPKNQDIEVGSSNTEVSVQDATLIETVSKLQVFDASSVEDTDSASMGLHEQYYGKSTVYEPQLVESEVGSSVFKFDEGYLDSSKLAVMDTEVGSAIVKLANGDADLIGTSSEMQILEARSLEDINAAFKQLHEEGLEKGVKVESEYGSLTLTADNKPQSILEVKNEKVGNTEVELVKGDSDLKERISELQVLDARSLEDTDSAFRQLREHDHQKSVEGPQLVESEISLHETLQDGEHPEHVEVPSDIQVLPAGSVEDIHVVLRPALYETVESQPKTLATEVTKIHVEPVVSSQTAEENLDELRESHVSSITEPSAGKPKNVVGEPESSDSNNKSTSKLVTEATEINVEPVAAPQSAEENPVELKESTPAEGSSITEEQSAGKPEDEARAPESSGPSKSARELMAEVTEIHVEPFAPIQTAEENQVNVGESPVVESSSMAGESSAGKQNDEVKASESSDSNKSTSKLVSEVTEIDVDPVAPSQIAEETQVGLRESPVVESSPIAEEPSTGEPKDEVKAAESLDSNKPTSKRKSKKKSGSGSNSSSSSSSSSSDSD